MPNEAFANDKGLSQWDAKSKEAGNRDGQERGFKQSPFTFSKILTYQVKSCSLNSRPSHFQSLFLDFNFAFKFSGYVLFFWREGYCFVIFLICFMLKTKIWIICKKSQPDTNPDWNEGIDINLERELI